MSEKLTCKDCQAFLPEEEGVVEGEGVCVLNPPQMFIGKDPETGEENVISVFPQVDGRVTSCMKLLLISVLFLFSGCSIVGAAIEKTWEDRKYRNSPAFYRDHVVCTTRRNPWQQIETICR
jgi:hypothetical protein